MYYSPVNLDIAIALRSVRERSSAGSASFVATSNTTGHEAAFCVEIDSREIADSPHTASTRR